MGTATSGVVSYEIIHEQTQRVLLIEQGGDQRNIRHEAHTLAEFLDKPLWDAI